MIYRHARLLPVPEAHTLGGALLEDIRQERRGQRQDLIIDYLELRSQGEMRLFLQGGRPQEEISGSYIPHRLRLCNVKQVELKGLFSDLSRVPPEHAVRNLRGCLFFRSTTSQTYFILFAGSSPAGLMADPRRCVQEERPAETHPVSLVRDWSPAPPSPPRLVPDPKTVRARFGGDPVVVRLGRRVYHRRLFIGDLSMQMEERPQVDAVLNLSEEPAPWFQGMQAQSEDRWAEQGEGSLGMSLAAIAAEANWVVQKLHQGKRVLVHCLAGMNRSSTICCAALIHLEGLTAEAALARVRQTHPWAHPDAHHWIRLRWLAHNGH